MTAEYSVDEVRSCANCVHPSSPVGFEGMYAKASNMLTAYADLLERIKADEGVALIDKTAHEIELDFWKSNAWSALKPGLYRLEKPIVGTSILTPIHPTAQAAQVDGCRDRCQRLHPHCQLRLTRDIWPDVNWHWGVTMPDGHLYDNSHGAMTFEQALADLQARGVTALDAADVIWRKSHATTAEPVAQGEAEAVERAAKAMWEVVPRGVPWSNEVASANDWRMLARAALAAQPRAVPKLDAEDWAVLQRLRNALPDVGLNGWHRGVIVLSKLLDSAPPPGESA